MNVGQFNIQNRRNANQQGLTPIFNEVHNRFTFEIRKDCESIPKCLTALAPLAQGFSVQEPPTNTPLTQVLSVSEPSVPIKAVFDIVTPKKVVIPEEIPSNAEVLNSCFMNKINDIYIDKAHKKSRLVVKAYNNNKNFVLM